MEGKDLPRIETRDDIDTLPKGIIELLKAHSSERPDHYMPSSVARIINRSIKQAYTDRDITGRGKYLKVDPVEYHMKAGSTVTINDPPYTLIYKGIVYPGLTHGEEIMTALDAKLESGLLKKATKEEILRLAALGTVVVGATHPFPDANGRTGIGLADYLTTSFLGETLDYNHLVAKAKEIDIELGASTHLMLPVKYNPIQLIRDLERNNQTDTTVDMSAHSLQDRGELLVFIDEFKRNIIHTINDYDPLNQTDGFLSVNTHIAGLANIYESALEISRTKGFLQRIALFSKKVIKGK